MESTKYPTIHFNMEDLNPGSETWLSTCKQVMQAFEEHGFFVAVQDGLISTELSNQVFKELERLFSLPEEVKRQNTSDTVFYFGYNPPSAKRPLTEALTIESPTSLQAVNKFSNLMWPSGNKNFCENVHLMAKQVVKLQQMLMKMVLESYGLDKYYDYHKESVFHGLRFNKYRPLRSHVPEIASPAHTDKDWTTVVLEHQVTGLQIKPKDSDLWVPVDMPCGSLAVFAGDALTAWSNGRVHGSLHQVVIQGEKDRYSIAQFEFLTKAVQAPEELVDDEHPLLYKPFDNLGLLRFYASPEGQEAENLLKAYCGI